MHSDLFLAASETVDSSVAWFVATLVATFAATWVVSKLFARQRGTLQNAILYYVFHFIGSLLLGLGAYGLLRALPSAEEFIAVVVLIAALVLALWIPMLIYEIGVLRAFCFVIVAAIGGVLASLILGGGVMIYQLKQAGFSFASLSEVTPVVALEDRQDLTAKINQLYAELQRERSALNNSDPAAVARFNARVAEYNSLRSQLVTAKR
jgi:hypothetical protein